MQSIEHAASSGSCLPNLPIEAYIAKQTGVEPTRLIVRGIACDQYLDVLESLGFRLSREALCEAWNSLENGKPIDLRKIFTGAPMTADVLLAGARTWTFEGRMKEQLQFLIENECLEEATAKVICRLYCDRSSPKDITLEINWGDILEHLGLRVERWSLVRQVLQTLGKTPPADSFVVNPDGSVTTAASDGYAFHVRQRPLTTEEYLSDSHLARHPTIQVLAANALMGEVPEIARIMLRRILGDWPEQGQPPLIASKTKSLEELFAALPPAELRTRSLAFIVFDDVILTVGPKTTLDTLKEDFEALCLLRESLMKGSKEVLQPSLVRISNPESARAQEIAQTCGFSLRPGLTAHFEAVLRDQRDFDPEMLFELAASKQSVAVSLVEEVYWWEDDCAEFDQYIGVTPTESNSGSLMWTTKWKFEDKDELNEEDVEDDDDEVEFIGEELDEDEEDGEFAHLDESLSGEDEEDDFHSGVPLEIITHECTGVDLHVKWGSNPSPWERVSRWRAVEEIGKLIDRSVNPKDLEVCDYDPTGVFHRDERFFFQAQLISS